MTNTKHESSTKREMRILRDIEKHFDYSQFEIGHPIRGLKVELDRLRQERLMRRLKEGHKNGTE